MLQNSFSTSQPARVALEPNVNSTSMSNRLVWKLSFKSRNVSLVVCAVVTSFGKRACLRENLWGPSTSAPEIYRPYHRSTSLHWMSRRSASKMCHTRPFFRSDKIALYSISFHLAKLEFNLIIKNRIVVDRSRLSSCRRRLELNIDKIVNFQTQGNLNS